MMQLNQLTKKNRLKLIKKIIFNELKIDAGIISNLSNIRYLSGFTGDSSLLLGVKNNTYLITDSRYTLQAKKDILPDIKLIIYKTGLLDEIIKILKQNKISVLGIEENNLTYKQFKTIETEYKKIKFIDIYGLIIKIRSIKDTEEIKYIKKALKIAEKSFIELKTIPGKTEKEIAAELEYIMKKNGADDISFPTIVAAGKNSALPHYQPGNTKIKKNDIILIDFGAVYKGYHSDTTRIIFLGNINKKLYTMYKVVAKALELGINLIKFGERKSNKVDFEVDKFIRDSGYKDGLIHSIGHGVGLDIHEHPILNRKKIGLLEPGMVFTIEPGIYMEGLGGIRLENMIYIDNNNKVKNSNKLPILFKFH